MWVFNFQDQIKTKFESKFVHGESIFKLGQFWDNCSNSAACMLPASSVMSHLLSAHGGKAQGPRVHWFTDKKHLISKALKIWQLLIWLQWKNWSGRVNSCLHLSSLKFSTFLLHSCFKLKKSFSYMPTISLTTRCKLHALNLAECNILAGL